MDPESSLLVREYLCGVANEEYLMMKLLGQLLLILFVGIVLWRILTAFFRRNQSRKPNMFEQSRFQKHWRRR